MLTASVSRSVAPVSVAREYRPTELSVVVLYGAGDLASLADAFGDVPEVAAITVLCDQIEIAIRGGQQNLSRLIELATLCDVELLAVILLPAGRLHSRAGAPTAPVIDSHRSPIRRA